MDLFARIQLAKTQFFMGALSLTEFIIELGWLYEAAVADQLLRAPLTEQDLFDAKAWELAND